MWFIITILTVPALALRLTYCRHRAAASPSGQSQAGALIKGYFPWLCRSIKKLFAPGFIGRANAFYKDWEVRYYPGRQKWILAAFLLSFLYLAVSGFGFALFSSRGMFGSLLILHVMAGGVFAVSLAAMLFVRARHYRWDEPSPTVEKRAHCPLFKNVSPGFLQKALFWSFSLAGLLLTATALGSMLSWFSFETHLILIDVHRYAALTAILTAMAFFDSLILPRAS